MLRIYKNASGASSLTYAEALDQALCYGWIDGQKKLGDGESWLQKFTPRRPNSGWSKNNTQRAQRLVESGEMTPAGLKEVKAAKGEGSWKSAYDSFSKATIPDDFLQALAKPRRRKRSSKRSTELICTQSLTVSKQQRRPKPGIDG
jgi:uncharacterized protein YdeI (YjbR/CyaY-like superfamily)